MNIRYFFVKNRIDLEKLDGVQNTALLSTCWQLSSRNHSRKMSFRKFREAIMGHKYIETLKETWAMRPLSAYRIESARNSELCLWFFLISNSRFDDVLSPLGAIVVSWGRLRSYSEFWWLVLLGVGIYIHSIHDWNLYYPSVFSITFTIYRISVIQNLYYQDWHALCHTNSYFNCILSISKWSLQWSFPFSHFNSIL